MRMSKTPHSYPHNMTVVKRYRDCLKAIMANPKCREEESICKGMCTTRVDGDEDGAGGIGTDQAGLRWNGTRLD